ncbi:hypothetical protein KCV06_g640, partial [Aureobasidium melanogenum]
MAPRYLDATSKPQIVRSNGEGCTPTQRRKMVIPEVPKELTKTFWGKTFCLFCGDDMSQLPLLWTCWFCLKKAGFVMRIREGLQIRVQRPFSKAQCTTKFRYESEFSSPTLLAYCNFSCSFVNFVRSDLIVGSRAYTSDTTLSLFLLPRQLMNKAEAYSISSRHPKTRISPTSHVIHTDETVPGFWVRLTEPASHLAAINLLSEGPVSSHRWSCLRDMARLRKDVLLLLPRPNAHITAAVVLGNAVISGLRRICITLSVCRA